MNSLFPKGVGVIVNQEHSETVIESQTLFQLITLPLQLRPRQASDVWQFPEFGSDAVWNNKHNWTKPRFFTYHRPEKICLVFDTYRPF